MGLVEKRAIAELKENFPKYQKELDGALSFPVEVVVHWDELAVEKNGPLYDEYLSKVFVRPVVEGVKSICQDKMGQDALKASLKKIEFRNSKDAYSPASAISFQGGTLLIDHSLSNFEDIKERANYITQTLEKAL